MSTFTVNIYLFSHLEHGIWERETKKISDLAHWNKTWAGVIVRKGEKGQKQICHPVYLLHWLCDDEQVHIFIMNDYS